MSLLNDAILYLGDVVADSVYSGNTLIWENNATKIITESYVINFVNTPYDPGSGKVPMPSGGETRGQGSGDISPQGNTFSINIGHSQNTTNMVDQIGFLVMDAANNTPAPTEQIERIYVPDAGWFSASTADVSGGAGNDSYPGSVHWKWPHVASTALKAGGNKTITVEWIL